MFRSVVLDRVTMLIQEVTVLIEEKVASCMAQQNFDFVCADVVGGHRVHTSS